MPKIECPRSKEPFEILFDAPVFLSRTPPVYPPSTPSFEDCLSQTSLEALEEVDAVHGDESFANPWGWEEDELFRLAHSPHASSEAEPDILSAAGLSREARFMYILSNPFWSLSFCGLLLAIFAFSFDLYLQNRPFSLNQPEASGARVAPQSPHHHEPALTPTMQAMQKRIQRIAHEPLPAPYRRLRTLFPAKSLPVRGEWLALQYEEGQSIQEYKESLPVRPDKKRGVIYLQPLGEMSHHHKKAVNFVARYMEAFFCSSVKMRKAWDRLPIPPWATRQKPEGNPQLHTRYVLFHILKPRLPKDALMLIALTQRDLWPGMGWSYVFGEASLNERVGVWSMARYGEPSRSPAAFRQLLLRTLKTSLHEAGHILSLPHCIGHDCVMNGSNHLEEADRHPAFLCPHCMTKLCWNLQCDPRKRLLKLRDLASEMGLKDLAKHHEQAYKLLLRRSSPPAHR
ncbi:MAG: hypothetical protein H6727_14465 [Myxococcales bacterium]|nr:hypothetical protein [Myxococcales bacterium]